GPVIRDRIVASPGRRHPCRWPGLVTADWLKREELLSGHAAPGHRTQAVASTLLADRAIRDDQIGAFPTAHPILERPPGVRRRVEAGRRHPDHYGTHRHDCAPGCCEHPHAPPPAQRRVPPRDEKPPT